MRKAFTLMEVVLVIALLVIFTAITVPALDRLYGDIRLNAAADTVRARWADCRSHAMEEGIPYRFAIQPDTGKFKIAPETQDNWDDATELSEASDDPENQPLVKEDELPEKVVFNLGVGNNSSMSSSGGWTKIGTFLPNGSCREDIYIVFKMDGLLPLALKLRGITGTVRLETLKEEQ